MRKFVRRGQATLTFIILVSGIIIEIAIAGSFVTYFLSTSGFGERASARALAAAEAGIRDAQLKVARNKEFWDFSTPYTYTLDVTVGGQQDAAEVAVQRTIDVVTNRYRYAITSEGQAATRRRTLVASMVVDQASGLVQLESLREQAVP